MQHIVNTDWERQYVVAVATLKAAQKTQSNEAGRVSIEKQSANMQAVIKQQENHKLIANLYGAELALSISESPGIIRKIAHDGRYSLQYITVYGQITIYSYPKNQAVLPKIEVHHPSYGFIAWWYKDDFEKSMWDVLRESKESTYNDKSLYVTHDSIWEMLCTRYKFDPDDPSAVDAATARFYALIDI